MERNLRPFMAQDGQGSDNIPSSENPAILDGIANPEFKNTSGNDITGNPNDLLALHPSEGLESSTEIPDASADLSMHTDVLSVEGGLSQNRTEKNKRNDALIDKVLAGDLDAVENLYNDLFKRLAYYFRRHSGLSKETIEDYSQEVITEIFTRLPGLKLVDLSEGKYNNIISYCRKSASNILYDHRKAIQRKKAASLDLLLEQGLERVDDSPKSYRELEKEEILAFCHKNEDLLKRILGKTNYEHFPLIVLGLSKKEIADMRNIKETSVPVITAIIRKTLRAYREEIYEAVEDFLYPANSEEKEKPE